jgi:hypothetical protein
MASRNPYREILETELKRWPDVFWELDDGALHKRVTFYVGMNTQFINYSRGSQKLDGGRGVKNFRAEIRRLLRSMGAKEAA